MLTLLRRGHRRRGRRTRRPPEERPAAGFAVLLRPGERAGEAAGRRGRLTPDALDRLKGLVTGSLSKDAFADADLVIEAVFEELSVKQQVFAEVEAVVSTACVLATNTSALSVTEMAPKLEHPERVLGLRFFNPVAVLPLVEVVRAEHTDDASWPPRSPSASR